MLWIHALCRLGPMRSHEHKLTHLSQVQVQVLKSVRADQPKNDRQTTSIDSIALRHKLQITITQAAKTCTAAHGSLHAQRTARQGQHWYVWCVVQHAGSSPFQGMAVVTESKYRSVVSMT